MRLTVHCCPFDKECRQYHAPARLQFTVTLRGRIYVASFALTPNARFVPKQYPNLQSYRPRWTSFTTVEYQELP